MSQDLQAFNSFPRVPSPGTISLFEAEARIHAFTSNVDQPADCTPFTDILKDYHNIDGRGRKPLFSHKNVDPIVAANVKSFILHEDQGLVKGLWTAMMDNGLVGMRRYLRHVERSPTSLRVCQIVELASAFVTVYQNVLDKLFYRHPYYQMDNEELIEEFAPVREWRTSWIKAIAWHPTYSKLAVASHDDTIRIYANDNSIIPLIRSEDQVMVACIAFRPYEETEIAVAVENGVLIWDISTECSIKPSRGQSQLYTAKGHSPVSCVNYSNSGHFLISSSSVDNSIIVWLITLSGCESMYRMQCGGVPLALWSPNDSIIFSSSPTSSFRLWEAENKWSSREFHTSGKHVEAACWSPCSKMVMFACDSGLYIIHLKISDLDKILSEANVKSKIFPIFNLRECLVDSEDGKHQYKVGGRVRQIVWDQTGTRVAVMFDDSELIPIFRVQPQGIYFVDPIGYIKGHPGEYPVAMAFQNNFSEGALLVIAFVTGRVQYFPLLFVNPTNTNKNIFHMDNYRLPVPVMESRPSLLLSTREIPNTVTSFVEDMYLHADIADKDLAEAPRLFSTSMMSSGFT